MAIGYYGVKLSDNWVVTPEGYIVFKNAVIARTGFQLYKGKELPQEELVEQGFSIGPEDNVNVYRSPEEVFSKKTLCSFNGKIITDGHPDNLLTIDTVEDHDCGHIINVRKGEEALQSGDWPLLADLIVTSKSLINKIHAGLRELSCGYNYHILRDGDNILQVDITGNHVAVVPKGRAGPHAKINDSLPTLITREKFSMSKFDSLIRALGFKEFAKDAKPEDIAAAMDGMAAKSEEKKEPKADDVKPTVASDAKAIEREKLHKALDRALDAKEAVATDADMDSLTKLFGGTAIDAKKKDDDEDEDADEDEKTDATDDDEDDEPEGNDDVDSDTEPIDPENRAKPDVPSAVDAAYQAGMKAALKAFKPFVAATKDKRFKGAFDTASKLAKGNAKAAPGAYGKFAKAAGVAGDSVGKRPEDMANDAYAAARKSHGRS